MMTRLALIRHGHTTWNRAGRIQGRTDIPLDAEAIHDLRKLRLPDGWSSATLWSSPLARAFHTGELIADRTPRRAPALIEMNWGDWEGQQGKTLKADPTSGFRDIESWGWDYTPPNGESLDALRRRIRPWLDTLEGDNIAVCHIGVMRVLLAMATGWAFAGPAPFQIKRNRLYILERRKDDWQWDGTPVRLEPR